MGLDLAGILPIARAGAHLAAAGCRRDRSRSPTVTGSVVACVTPGPAPRRAWPTGWAAGSSPRKGGWLASFGLGAIFAIGWTPCIGIILGGILTMAATSGTAAQGAILLIAYTLGLGLPFLAIAAVYDRAPAIRHRSSATARPSR